MNNVTKPRGSWQTATPQQPTVAVLQPIAPATTGTTVAGTGAAPAAVVSGYGTGAPTYSAPNGTLYIRKDGVHGSTTLLYINTSGANLTGTTWTAIA